MRKKITYFIRSALAAPSLRGVLLGLTFLTLITLFSCKDATPRRTPAPHQERLGNHPAPATTAFAEPQIRVALVHDVREIRLDAPGGIIVARPDGSEVLRSAAGAIWNIGLASGGLSLNGQLERGPAVRLECLDAQQRITLEGREIARRIDVYTDAKRGGSLTAVAFLDLEEYLVGVLAGEVPYARWGREALKAQGVVSRSYALSQAKVHAHEPYDVESTIMSQVFRPGNRHNAVLLAALEATRGQVLTCKGQFFHAYFHSTCGGGTAAVQTVFADQAQLSVLSGVRCPFCAQSPAFQWTATIRKDELKRRLAACPDLRGQALGDIRALEFFDLQGSAGRAAKVRIRHVGGENVLNANRFRLAVGPSELRSVVLEKITDQGDALVFQGRGFGHGVGLCQYGSQGMAAQNYTCAQILGFYFPGGELTQMYGVATALR